MATYASEVITGNDDWIHEVSPAFFTRAATSQWFGFFNSNDQHSGMRFQSLDIPQGSTIDSAIIEIRATDHAVDGPTNTILIAGVKLDNPSGPANSSQCATHDSNRTTAQTGWSFSTTNVNNTLITTPDFKAVVQELADLGFLEGGKALIIQFTENNGGLARRQSNSTFEHATQDAAKITIQYTPPVEVTLSPATVTSAAQALGPITGIAVQLSPIDVGTSAQGLSPQSAATSVTLTPIQVSTTARPLEPTIPFRDTAWGLGDWIWAYEPPFLQDPSNPIRYAGSYVFPTKVRIVGVSRPITDEHGVFFRDHDGNIHDLSGYVVPSNSAPSLEVGDLLRSPIDTSLAGVVARGRATGDPFVDATIPAQVQNVVQIGSGLYFDATGSVRAWMTVGWDAVTQNTDASSIADLRGYRVRYGEEDSIIAGADYDHRFADRLTTQTAIFGLDPGQTYLVSVRAEDRFDNYGAYSTEQSLLAAESAVPPSIPAAPTVVGNPLEIQVQHDFAKDSAPGVPWVMEPDIIGFNVYVGDIQQFVIGAGNFVGFMPGTISNLTSQVPALRSFFVPVDGFDPDTERWVKVTAVNSSGLESDARTDGVSVQPGLLSTAHISDLTVTTAKIGDLAVTNAKIAELAVTNAKIQDLAVTNAKINDLDAVKITAGTLDADRIGAGTITAAKINVTSLSAIAANLGAVTAGSIVVGSTNKLWLNEGGDGVLAIGGTVKASAPFRVAANGTMVATQGSFGIYTIGNDPVSGEAGLIDNARSGTNNKIGLYGSAIEIGWSKSGGPGTASIDFHTGDDVNYNARINVVGGASGAEGGGMEMAAKYVSFPDGISTAPGIAFNSDKASGLYLFASGRPFMTGVGEMGIYRRTTTSANPVLAIASNVGATARSHHLFMAGGNVELARFGGSLSIGGSTAYHTGNHDTSAHGGMAHTGHYAGTTGFEANLRHFTTGTYRESTSSALLKSDRGVITAADAWAIMPTFPSRFFMSLHDGDDSRIKMAGFFYEEVRDAWRAGAPAPEPESGLGNYDVRAIVALHHPAILDLKEQIVDLESRLAALESV